MLVPAMFHCAIMYHATAANIKRNDLVHRKGQRENLLKGVEFLEASLKEHTMGEGRRAKVVNPAHKFDKGENSSPSCQCLKRRHLILRYP